MNELSLSWRSIRSRIAAIDASTWIILLGIAVRIDTAARFDVRMGYDTPNHMAYVDLLGRGITPRIDDPAADVASYLRQNPPFFYAVALFLRALGLGDASGVIISLVAGSARLLLADRVFRGPLALSPRARLFANALHAFIPFLIRTDIFYSNETFASTLALIAVLLALLGRWVWAGLLLGAAMLSKSSAVAAVPAVAFAAFSARGMPEGKAAWTRAALETAGAMGLAGLVLLPWAWPNLVKYGTPFPSSYMKEYAMYPEYWNHPLFERHKLSFYLPRFRYSDLTSPYSDNIPTLPNAFFLEAWGDYYNYLGREKPGSTSVNGHVLAPWMHRIHVAFVHVGLPIAIATVAGAIGAIRRTLKRQISREEVALGLLGWGYLLLAWWYAIFIAYEYHGAVKATYAHGAATILAAWTGRALDAAAGRSLWRAIPVCALVAAPALLTLFQRIVW